MKFIRPAALAALLLYSAVPLQAQTTVFSGTYTGGKNFTTTAAISLTYQLESAGVYLYQLNVTNQGVYGEIYASVALFNIPNSVTIQQFTGGVWAPSGWTPPPPHPLSDLEPKVASYDAAKPWPGNGFSVGQGGAFQFRLSNFTDLTRLSQVGAGLHAISGPMGCSGKLAVKNGEVVETSWDEDECGPPPTTVVPEPSTVILLGTGIAGILGFGYARRRRDEEEVS